MRKIVVSLILAGALAGASYGPLGCKADPASRAASEMDRAHAYDPHTPMQQPSPAGPDPDATHDPRPVVVCFGDSLTAGYGADEGKSYPDFLQKDLDRDGYNYRVVNDGISGDTTKDGVERMGAVVALKPAVVVLEFGGNDGLRGFKVPTTRANLSTMIETIKAGGAKVLLAGITLPPDYGKDYVTEFTASYPVLGKKYEVPVIPFILKDAYGVPGMIQNDGIHATDKGNEVVAKNVLKVLEPMLTK